MHPFHSVYVTDALWFSGMMEIERWPLRTRTWFAVVVVILAHSALAAPCMNKFLAQKDGPKITVTMLTGKLSYPEAFEYAQAVNAHRVPPPEWVDEKGKTISKIISDLKVVRPMPVSCDGKPSGVVMTATFLGTHVPSGKMYVKFDEKTTVTLDEQEK